MSLTGRSHLTALLFLSTDRSNVISYAVSCVSLTGRQSSAHATNYVSLTSQKSVDNAVNYISLTGQQHFKKWISSEVQKYCDIVVSINPYPTAFPYGNGRVLHFHQQQESSTTKTVHKVINKGLKAYV